jgi:hypothetical protein
MPSPLPWSKPLSDLSAQAALPPFFLHLERNAFRGLPCRPLAVAWSEHAFEIACFAGSAGFAAGADCPATGFAAGAVCAIVVFEPNTTTSADSIKVFENLTVISSQCGCSLHRCGRLT